MKDVAQGIMTQEQYEAWLADFDQNLERFKFESKIKKLVSRPTGDDQIDANQGPATPQLDADGMLKLDPVKSDATHVSATQISSLDNSRMAINKSDIATTTMNRRNGHHTVDSKAGDLEYKGKNGVADQGCQIGVNRFFRNSKSKIAVADEKADANAGSR